MSSKTAGHIKAVIYTAILAGIFTAAVAGVNHAMKDRIAANKKMRQAVAILHVLDIDTSKAENDTILQLMSTRTKEHTVTNTTYYEGISESGVLQAYVFQISGSALWGPVEGCIALDPALQTITGITFTAHNETPGLGARITEPEFEEQLKGKSAIPPADGSIGIRMVIAGKPKSENDIDAISGATQTSTAIEILLDKELRRIQAFMKSQELK